MLKEAKIGKRMKDELFTIKHILSLGIGLCQDTLKKKEMYENRFDKELMQTLRSHYERRHKSSLPKSKKKKSVRSYALESSMINLQRKSKDDASAIESGTSLKGIEEDVSRNILKKNLGDIKEESQFEMSNEADFEQMYDGLLDLINVNSVEVPYS